MMEDKGAYHDDGNHAEGAMNTACLQALPLDQQKMTLKPCDHSANEIDPLACFGMVAKRYCMGCILWQNPKIWFGKLNFNCAYAKMSVHAQNSVIDLAPDPNGETPLDGRRRGNSCYRPSIHTMPGGVNKWGAMGPELKSAIKKWATTTDAKHVCTCFQQWWKECQKKAGHFGQCVFNKICSCKSTCPKFKEEWGCSSLIQRADGTESSVNESETAQDHLPLLSNRRMNGSPVALSAVDSVESSGTGKCGS